MKRLGAVFATLMLLAVVVAYRLCDAWMVIEIVTRFHSERGSTNCGHVTNSTYHGERPSAEAAIACAQSALEHHRAFNVIFTGYGIDEEVSNALVADSDGKVAEILYATGAVMNRNRLLRHRCDFPTHLLIEKDSPFGFARLHCVERPPTN